MSEPSVPRAFDRRGFLQLLAGAAAALPAVAAAQAPTAPATTTTSAVPSPPATAATPAPATPEHSGAESRLLAEVLRARYPDRFTDAQWTSIVGDIDGDLAGSKRLRAAKLANGDEPDSTFRP